MVNNFKIIFFIGLLSFFSCKVEETEEKATNDPEIVRFDKNKMIDSINTAETSNRLNKYNSILINIDSLNYTYELQEIVNKREGPIAIIGYINDILQKENNFILKISGKIGNKDFVGHFLISTELFLRLKSEIGSNFPTNKCFFIVQPESITSSSLMEIDIDVFVDDISDAELMFDFKDSIFLVKGNLVDFYVFEAKKKNGLNYVY